MPRFIFAGTEDVLPEPGAMVEVRLEGQSIALCNSAGRYFAVENRCPHRGLPFIEPSGIDQEANLIICGWHGWRFSLTNGLCEGTHAPGVKTYPVRLVNGGFELGVDDEG